MKNKRVLVLGIALVFFALVVGSVFAEFGFKNGVRFENVELNGKLYIQLYNSNDFAVRVGLQHTWANANFVELAPGELKNVSASSSNAYINYVLKRDKNGYWERF
jgi:hypothetical protein